MTLRLKLKTLIVVGCSTLAMVLILWMISRAFWMQGYQHLEEEQVRQNATVVIGSIDGWLDMLRRTNGDWSGWDDTYEFIQNHNQSYIQANLVDGTFTELDLNFIIFIDLEGRIVYGNAFDPNKKKKIPLPENLKDYFLKNSDLLRHSTPQSAITGIILVEAGQDPIMVSSRPILTSGDQGPIRGTLLMGRNLSKEKLNDLGRLSGIQIQIAYLPDSPSDVLQELISGKQNGKMPILVKPKDKNFITGFTLIRDVFRRPAVILSISMLRDIYLEGEAKFRYYLASLLLLAVAFIGTTLFLLQRLIVNRVTFLNNWATRVDDIQNLPPFPPFGGADELAELAEAIKDSYLRIQKAEAISIQSQERYRMLVEMSPDMIFILTGEERRIHSLNASFEKITGWSGEDFIDRPFTDLLYPEDIPVVNDMFDRIMNGQKISPIEIRILTQSGDIRIEEVTAVPEIRSSNIVRIMGFAHDISERKQAELILLESERKLRQLSTLLLNAQEHERTRISQELHDELGQSLTVLKFKIRAVQKRLSEEPEIQAECLLLRQSIDQIIENVRRLSLDLRPSVLEDLGLWKSLQWLVRNAAHHYQIESRVEIDIIDFFIPPECQIFIFRIFQEALTNIGKHAQASCVYFSVKYSEGGIRLRIRDDGIGFDPSKTDQFTSDYKGLGIPAMYERARILGGNLEIRSQKDEGTEVTLIISTRKE